jgi:hypothetical protein
MVPMENPHFEAMLDNKWQKNGPIDESNSKQRKVVA